ncbi:MAG: C39 family peptidase [Atribacterota bacterium]|nr:C39 family peptidase [Atribacterota bacterium]
MKVWNKMKDISKLLIIISTVFILTSCSGIVPETIQEEQDINSPITGIEEKAKISSVYLDVPYQKYAGTNWCLPASGSMTLNYFGIPVSQQELAQSIIKPDGLGDIYKMVRFAQDLGFEASFKVLTIEEIEEYLTKNIPIIAIQEYKETNPLAHARVIIGFDSDKKEIISNDPTIGKGYTIAYDKFLNLNLTANPKYTMAIIITPMSV